MVTNFNTMIKKLPNGGWKAVCNFCGDQIETDSPITFTEFKVSLEKDNWIREKSTVDKSYPVYEDKCNRCRTGETHVIE